MNYKTLMAIAVSSVVATSMYAANLEVNVTKEPSTSQVKMAPVDKLDAPVVISDEQLLGRIQDLIKSSFSKYTIKVRVMDGTVFLDGFIGSASDKSALEAKIKEIKGVKEIKDNLQIGAPSMQMEKHL